ncbi:MAG: DeoR family transcriptional regulator [Candidatus Aenigmarchaeota archaeon]|nr:DeoR family transcriptional regulator [Candidatus Aenigmarchaeota archaeon]
MENAKLTMLRLNLRLQATDLVLFFIGRKSDRNLMKTRYELNTNQAKIRHKSDAETRQKWILDYLKQKGTIKSIEIINKFKVVKDTAYHDLNNLIEEDKIVKKGAGNNVWYELK